MDKRVVITIGRESGSGGRRIGVAIAKKLGIKCYDKELIAIAAKESGLCEEIMETHDEVPTRSFLYSLVMDTYGMNYHSGSADLPIEQKVFLAQYNSIKKIAANESAVFVGRCADYALEDDPDLISIFITCDEKDCIRHIMETYGYSESKAKDFINKTNKRRANYYNYYSSKKWGEASTYDLCVNRSRLGLERTVDAIVAYVQSAMNK